VFKHPIRPKKKNNNNNNNLRGLAFGITEPPPGLRE